MQEPLNTNPSNTEPLLATPQPGPTEIPTALPALLKETGNACFFPDPDVNPIPVLDAIKRAVLDGCPLFGFRVPTCSSVTFVFGERADLNTAANLWGADLAEGRLAVVRPQTQASTNFLIDEGGALIRATTPPKSDMVVVIVSKSSKTWQQSASFVPALIEAAGDRCTNAVIVFKGFSSDAARSVSGYFDACMTVEACQPDDGYTTAYIASAMPGTSLEVIAGEPVIENIRQGPDGRLERSTYPCRAKDPLTREMAALYQSGLTLEEIGLRFGVNKSTVQRRLEPLRIQRRRQTAARQVV